MSDFLLNLSSNPQARNLIKKLGLPIPMPEQLKRAKGGTVERPFENHDIVVYTTAGSQLGAVLAETLAAGGANPFLFGAQDALPLFKGPGEAYGRPAETLDLDDESGPDVRPAALVFDGSALSDPSQLRQAYDFFHPIIRSLGKSGRVVILGRPPEDQKTAAAASAQAGLSGLMRSISKEVGKKGATAHLLYVQEGAEAWTAGPLRFCLSSQSTYVTGQPLTVTKTGATEVDGWTAPLEGKIALVTGAARGIGAQTARVLADEGATVVCLDLPRDDGPTSKLARELGGHALLADLTAPDAHSVIADRLKADFGGVDVVVHNAGITRDKMLRNMSPKYWDQAVGVNLEAVTRVTAALLDGVLRENGRLICLSSIAGLAGNAGQTNYSTAKSGIVGYVKWLSSRVAKHNITVNAVAPGFIETRLTDAMPVALREVARRMNSLGQGGRPIDVARAVAFFATPGAAGLNGQILRVCGQSLVGA